MLNTNNFKKSVLIHAFIFVFLFMPMFVFSQGGNTGGTNTGIVYECNNANPGDCTYTDLVRAVTRVINWLIIFTLEFSVVVIAYAGFKFMISGDNPGERAAASKMLWSVVKGIFFVLAAWLIVNLIARALLTPAVLNVTPPVAP